MLSVQSVEVELDLQTSKLAHAQEVASHLAQPASRRKHAEGTCSGITAGCPTSVYISASSSPLGCCLPFADAGFLGFTTLPKS